MNFVSAHGICAGCVLETAYAAALVTVVQAEFHHENPMILSTGLRLFETLPKPGPKGAMAEAHVVGQPYAFVEFAERMKPFDHILYINQNRVFPFSTVLYHGSALCPPHMLWQRDQEFNPRRR